MYIILSFAFTYGFTLLPNTRIVVFPGYGCNDQDYQSLQTICAKYAINVDSVPIQRWEWLSILKGITTKEYWNYQCSPNVLFDWYLKKASRVVKESVKRNHGHPVILCGHSTGGWLARSLIQNGTFYGSSLQSSSNYVSTLLTLGTPNIGHDVQKYDTTRGCLRYIQERYPIQPDISYITVGSSARKVDLQDHCSTEDAIIMDSYLRVLGKTNKLFLQGDGIVPLEGSHIPGAKHVNFHDVYHFKTSNNLWYFDEEIVVRWLFYLEESLQLRKISGKYISNDKVDRRN